MAIVPPLIRTLVDSATVKQSLNSDGSVSFNLYLSGDVSVDQDTSLATVASTGGDAFSAVATSGSYNDLSNKPISGQAAGYGTPTGGSHQTSFAAYAGQTQPVSYNQTDIQALDNAVKAVSQALAQLIVDLKAGNLPAA
jgi:hypothetical protein